MKSNSLIPPQSTVLGMVILTILAFTPVSIVQAQSLSIEGQIYRDTDDKTLIDDTENVSCSTTQCAVSRVAMLTAGTSQSCSCCPDGNCDEACKDGSCLACKSAPSAIAQCTSQMPLAYSNLVRSTDAIPPFAECPVMDTRSIEVKPESAGPAGMMSSLSMNQYCSDMAELLVKSISDPSVDDDTRQFAIESALKMAVRNTEIQMDSRIEKMNVRFDNEMSNYQNQAEQAAMTYSAGQVQQIVSPIYQSLDRIYYQMRMMQASDVKAERSMQMLEQMAQQTMRNSVQRQPIQQPRQRITLRSPQQQPEVRNGEADYRQSAGSDQMADQEVNRLRRQVQLLEAQLYAANIQSQPVPARTDSPSNRYAHAAAYYPLPQTSSGDQSTVESDSLRWLTVPSRTSRNQVAAYPQSNYRQDSEQGSSVRQTSATEQESSGYETRSLYENRAGVLSPLPESNRHESLRNQWRQPQASPNTQYAPMPLRPVRNGSQTAPYSYYGYGN